jgi:signal peptidase I
LAKFKIFLEEILITVSLALIISFLIQNFFLEPRIVPTGSMLPTIQINQRILVNKLAYKMSSPKRGDVIVFKPPIETEDNSDFIKRVIGIGGDTVEVKNGLILINGNAIEENYLIEKPNYDFGPVTVPEDSLFVLGDNRNCSFDSHIWGQWLKIDNVKGKAFFTYWPLEYMGLLK